MASHAWPFKEAEALLNHIGGKLPKKGYVLFETGYGPSGLPHIGTFGEVVRTTMVRKAFEQISGMPTRLFCVSDDIDGMRKIPDTIPNGEAYRKYMDWPLTSIPDPFGTHPSFGENMNARLRSFLDTFGFEYEFKSTTHCYRNGEFNDALLKVLECYEEIMELMLSTLREERQKTYSPFMPICKKTGKVLQVPILEVDKKQGLITFKDLDGELITTEVTNGKCKLQWKPDFGMRWMAFDVDFEMYGKDHLANGPVYTEICKILGGKGPHQMFYELFLDEEGKKISKSKGNGVTINQWLHYAPQESLALFMYQNPRRAKALSLNLIPKNVDDYLNYLQKYQEEEQAQRFDNPVFHIHHGNPPKVDTSVNYSLLLNLISACNTADESVVWRYIERAAPEVDRKSPLMNAIVSGALKYYEELIKPHKKFRAPTEQERKAMLKLAEVLRSLEGMPAEAIQTQVYSVGKEFGFTELREWFKALYEVLLGASQGPRFGSFVALYGVKETITLIENAVK
jgi:lysyl-tRNA synthetase class 1